MPRGLVSPVGRIGLPIFYHREGKPVNHPIPIPYEEGDEPVHTDDHLFCSDPACPCHEESESLAQVQSWISDGLITTEDADRIYRGMTV